MVEQLAVNELVPGSSPGRGAKESIIHLGESSLRLQAATTAGYHQSHVELVRSPYNSVSNHKISRVPFVSLKKICKRT